MFFVLKWCPIWFSSNICGFLIGYGISSIHVFPRLTLFCLKLYVLFMCCIRRTESYSDWFIINGFYHFLTLFPMGFASIPCDWPINFMQRLDYSFSSFLNLIIEFKLEISIRKEIASIWCLPVKRRFSGYCDAKSFLNVTRIGPLVNPFSIGTTELLYQMCAKASKYTFDVYSEKKLLLAFTFENWNWHFLGVFN